MSDATWDELVKAADRLSQLSDDTVGVSAYRRGLFRVVDGLEAGDLWTEVPPERVRWRWRGSGRWHEVQPVSDAASKIETFMRRRPDLK